MKFIIFFLLALHHILQVQSDPALDEYLKKVIENIRNLMPTGDPDLHIPILDPYNIKDVSSDTKNKNVEITLKLQNLVLVGLSKFQLKTLNIDMQKMVMNVDVLFPELIVSGNYFVNGKAMKIFPIYGNGKSVIGVKNFQMNALLGVQVDWTNGQLKFSSFDMTLDFSEAMINLENILGGGSLSDMVNMLANSMVRPMFEKNKSTIEAEIKKEVSKMLEKELKKVDIRNIINKMSDRSIQPLASFPDMNSVNKYVDLLLENAKANPDLKIDPLIIENQSHKSSGVKIDVNNGRVFGLRSVHRVGDMVLNCDQTTSKCLFTGEIGVDNIQAEFDTHLRWHFIRMSPSIDGKVGEIRVKFAIHLDIQGRRGEVATLQSFEISTFSTPKIKIGNMGLLGKVLSFLMKLIGPLVKNKIKNAVESPMREAIVKSLTKVAFEF